MPQALLSDADVGIGVPPASGASPPAGPVGAGPAAPRLLSDADVGIGAPAAAPHSGPAAADYFGDLAGQAGGKADAARDNAPMTGAQMYGGVAPAGSPPASLADTPIGHIAKAAAQGWQDSPSILTDEGQQAVDQYGGIIGREIINPALKVVGGALLSAPSAAMNAIAETANQVTGNPQAGRDVMAALQVLPILHGSAPPMAIGHALDAVGGKLADLTSGAGRAPVDVANAVVNAPTIDAAIEAATGAVKGAGEAKTGEVLGAGDLWRTDPGQLQTMLDEKNLSDRQKVVRALGSEPAAVDFFRLDRKQNSDDPQRAAEGAAEFNAKFGNLTPEQERLIYGIGDTGAQAGEIQQVLDAHSNRSDNPADAGYEAAIAIRSVPAADILAVPKGGASPAAQAAYVRLGNAYADMHDAGVPSDQIAPTIAAALVQHGGWSPGDAADVVGDFIEQARRASVAASVDQPRIAGAAGTAPDALTAGPQPAGADITPQNQAAISTADMKANRRVNEQRQIQAPPEAGDTTIHVEGSFPTLAEHRGDPVLSQYENLLRERNPGEFVGDGKRLTENNKARVNKFDGLTIPDTVLNTMRGDRDKRWNDNADGILPTAQPADLSLAYDWVTKELQNRRIQENDAIASVLTDFRDRLVDKTTGDLKTDPAAVWGMHDHLQNQLSKAKDPLNASSAEKFSMAQIMAAKDHIDRAMNVATDNRFQTALDQYAADSKAINVGVLLNDYRPHLTNMTGELQAQRYHNWVASLAKERGDPGIDPSMDIPDKAMQSLISIDTDLKRAKLIKLGAPAGSQTNLLGALAEKAGLKAAHALVGKIPILGPVLNVGTDYMAQRKLVADTAKHLAEPEGGYTYPEPDEQTAGGPAAFNRPVPAASGTSSPDTPPQPAPAPSAAPAANAPARGATGAGPGESIAFTPSNAAVPVRYTVRDASDLIASQLADGRTNPKFPAALQPRDRTRVASTDQINGIATKLNPELLGASASTSMGAPIIGPDGAVESGNGRTMAIMQAYADGGPRADAYRQWVSAQGHDTTGMQNPILVRERLGDLDMPARARLAADMGASPIAAMSAPERAAADARAIPTDILSMYQGGDVTRAKTAPFARAFAEHVIPPGEHAGFMTADGEMSADGAIRMRNALTQHAYGSNSLVTSLAENADPDIKAFGGAMMDAAGDMAKLRGAIDSGAVASASDIAPDIVAAAQLIQTARRQRISVADAVGQRDAFSVLPEKTEDILQSAFGEDYAGRMSRSRMAELLSAFAQEAQMQSGLFGANLTAGEMLAEARAKYGYGTKANSKGRAGVSVGNGAGLDFNRP